MGDDVNVRFLKKEKWKNKVITQKKQLTHILSRGRKLRVLLDREWVNFEKLNALPKRREKKLVSLKLKKVKNCEK